MLGSALVLSTLTAGVARAAEGTPVVAAAASLRFALPGLAAAFAEAAGGRIRTSVGSSGNLARQALRGAPFQVFLAADRDYPARLVAAGRARGAPVVYALGRLVLYRAGGGPASPQALRADGSGRIALANPDHAPYGRAARRTLDRLGLWPMGMAAGRLVVGENAAQAAQFAFSGNAAWALLPLALVRTGDHRGRWTLVPPDHHPPVRHAMVLLKGAGETAAMFFRFMQGPAARAVLTKYGFEAPADSD